MLTKQQIDYLVNLARIRSVDLILDAYGLLSPALGCLLQKSRALRLERRRLSAENLRLDTIISNFSRDTFFDLWRVLPPDLCASLANHDEISRQLAAKFLSMPSETNNKRASRVYSCQQNYMLLDSTQFEAKRRNCIIPYSCNQRFCPECSRKRSRDTYGRVVDHLAFRLKCSKPNLIWVTLTIANPPAGELESGIKALLSAFRRLRQPHVMNGKRGADYNCWTESVRGYLWNLEVSHNSKMDTWHPHIHIIMDSDFIPWQVLKAEWFKALRPTGCAGDVKLGQAFVKMPDGSKRFLSPDGDPRDALDCLIEVTKYNLKPFESDLPAVRIVELADAIFNKRLFGSGGAWHLPPLQSRRFDPSWAVEGGLAHVLQDPESSWADPDCQPHVLRACTRDMSAWLRIIRTYDVLRWIQYSDSHST